MVEMLERTHLVGGLNLQARIDAAQTFIAAAGNPVLVHVGTGQASLGQCDPKALLAKIPHSVPHDRHRRDRGEVAGIGSPKSPAGRAAGP